MEIMRHIKVKDLLDICKWGCGPFCVSLLTDRRLKGLSWDFVYVFQQWVILRLRVLCGTKRHTQNQVSTFYVTSPNFDVAECDN